jgi:hypothetical protein
MQTKVTEDTLRKVIARNIPTASYEGQKSQTSKVGNEESDQKRKDWLCSPHKTLWACLLDQSEYFSSFDFLHLSYVFLSYQGLLNMQHSSHLLRGHILRSKKSEEDLEVKKKGELSIQEASVL